MGGFLIITALIFDLFQFFASMAAIVLMPLIVLSWFVSMFAFITFLVWFKLCGVNYLDRNAATKLFISIASLVTELLPLVNMLPAITLGVLSLIAVSRMEDGKNGLTKLADKRRGKMSVDEKKQREDWSKKRFARDQEGLAAKRVVNENKRMGRTAPEQEMEDFLEDDENNPV